MVAFTNSLLVLLSGLSAANAYWLMGLNFLVTERLDPIVSPGGVSGHVHTAVGGSNFGSTLTTAKLRDSTCTSTPIPEDKSSYWFPHLYFQWANGSFTSLNGGTVIYYLFPDQAGTVTAFPDDFRMISGDPTLRTYTATSAQRAITFLCLNFNGFSPTSNGLPATECPDGIRAQINFPSCWDGKNVDSADHKSHVAFPSGGPDSGTCSDPNFPVQIPRVFMEVYWASTDFDSVRNQAMNTTQPFVYSYGDPTGYGYHADFFNGWASGVLQKAVDNCHCNIYGDPTCCSQAGIFDLTQGQSCTISATVEEQATGTIPKLPGNNPVVPEGGHVVMGPASSTPGFNDQVYVYTNGGSTPVATVAGGGSGGGAAPTLSASSSAAPVSSAASSSLAAVSSSLVSSSTVVSSSASSSAAPSSGSSSAGASPSFIVVPSSSSSAPTSSSSSTAAAQSSSVSSSSAAVPTSSSSSANAGGVASSASSASSSPSVSMPPVVSSSSSSAQPLPTSSMPIPAYPVGVPNDGGNSGGGYGGSGSSDPASTGSSSNDSSGSSSSSSGSSSSSSGQCKRGTRRKRNAGSPGSAFSRPRAARHHASDNHRRFNVHHV